MKKKNLHNCSNISTPDTIRLTQVGVEGVALTGIPSRLFKWNAKMASSRQLFSLIDLSLDVYLSIWSLILYNRDFSLCTYVLSCQLTAFSIQWVLHRQSSPRNTAVRYLHTLCEKTLHFTSEAYSVSYLGIKSNVYINW